MHDIAHSLSQGIETESAPVYLHACIDGQQPLVGRVEDAELGLASSG